MDVYEFMRDFNIQSHVKGIESRFGYKLIGYVGNKDPEFLTFKNSNGETFYMLLKDLSNQNFVFHYSLPRRKTK